MLVLRSSLRGSCPSLGEGVRSPLNFLSAPDGPALVKMGFDGSLNGPATGAPRGDRWYGCASSSAPPDRGGGRRMSDRVGPLPCVGYGAPCGSPPRRPASLAVRRAAHRDRRPGARSLRLADPRSQAAEVAPRRPDRPPRRRNLPARP